MYIGSILRIRTGCTRTIFDILMGCHCNIITTLIAHRPLPGYLKDSIFTKNLQCIVALCVLTRLLPFKTMKPSLTLALLVAVCCHFAAAYYYLRELENEVVLDTFGNIILRWTILRYTREIEFELQVNGTGWIGIGFLKGIVGQPGANVDIILSGYDDRLRRGYVEDKWADLSAPENGGVTLDARQDVKLISAKYYAPWTIVRLLRKLDTGDIKDNPIKPGPVRISWTFTNTDNTSVPHTPGFRGFNQVTFIPRYYIY